MQRLRESAHAQRSDNACAIVVHLLLKHMHFILSHTTSSCPQGHRKRRLATRAIAQRSACMNRRCSKGSKADSARTDAQSSTENSATCMTPNARSSSRTAAYACAEIRGTTARHTASNPWTSGPPSTVCSQHSPHKDYDEDNSCWGIDRLLSALPHTKIMAWAIHSGAFTRCS